MFHQWKLNSSFDWYIITYWVTLWGCYTDWLEYGSCTNVSAAFYCWWSWFICFRYSPVVRWETQLNGYKYIKTIKASLPLFLVLFPVRGLRWACHSLVPHTVACLWSLGCSPVEPDLIQRVWCTATICHWCPCWHSPETCGSCCCSSL